MMSDHLNVVKFANNPVAKAARATFDLWRLLQAEMHARPPVGVRKIRAHVLKTLRFDPEVTDQQYCANELADMFAGAGASLHEVEPTVAAEHKQKIREWESFVRFAVTVYADWVEKKPQQTESRVPAPSPAVSFGVRAARSSHAVRVCAGRLVCLRCQQFTPSRPARVKQAWLETLCGSAPSSVVRVAHATHAIHWSVFRTELECRRCGAKLSEKSHRIASQRKAIGRRLVVRHSEPTLELELEDAEPVDRCPTGPSEVAQTGGCARTHSSSPRRKAKLSLSLFFPFSSLDSTARCRVFACRPPQKKRP